MQGLMMGWSGMFVYVGIGILGFIALIFIDAWIRDKGGLD